MFKNSILQPASVTSSVPSINTNVFKLVPENMIDQNGLVTKYVSRETLYDSINTILYDPNVYDTPFDNWWQSQAMQLPYHLTFDLGGEYTIEGMALWTVHGLRGPIENFELFADTDDVFDPEMLEPILNSSGDSIFRAKTSPVCATRKVAVVSGRKPHGE